MEIKIRGTHLEIDDVRTFLAYAFWWCTFRRHTCSDDARIFLTCVRIFLAYVIWWRTYIATTCSCDVRIFLAYIFRRRTCSWRTCSIDVRTLSTYVCYRRTCSIDVRILWTYVIPRRTYSGLRFWRFRDYAFEIEDSGLRRTFWTLDLMQKIAVDSFSGLSIASKIMIDTIYIW